VLGAESPQRLAIFEIFWYNSIKKCKKKFYKHFLGGGGGGGGGGLPGPPLAMPLAVAYVTLKVKAQT